MDSFFHKLLSWGSDLAMGVAIVALWMKDFDHLIKILAPIGIPILFFIRFMAAVEEWRRNKAQRRIAEREDHDGFDLNR
jgi:hypothetical protein